MKDCIISALTEEFKLKKQNVQNTVQLIEDGNTIPFIARYRKEVTGNMSDDVLRDFDERLAYLKNLENRKEEVVSLIAKQELLTPELEDKINACTILKEVEDLYLPFKPKRRTRAIIAKEKGLEPLSEIILAQKLNEEEIFVEAQNFISEEKDVKTPEEAIKGASDIIAENISENADYKKHLRVLTFNQGQITSCVTKEFENERNEFEMYYNHSEPVRSIADHRVLALNRGEAKKVLKVKIQPPAERIIEYLNKRTLKKNASSYLQQAIQDSYKRLIEPSVEREIRSELQQRADLSAITVFSKNLKALLMTPPVRDKVIMGFDPAYRTGCKIAIIDGYGKLLDYGVVYPTAPQNRTEESKKILTEMILKHKVDVISIGNGTASRESELFVAELIRECPRKVEYIIVNEAGASVYSASKLGAAEYPELNVSIRGAISIAQRLKDPLAELVKIDPKHIGVGQYQHDVNQQKLSEALENIVEDAVNTVGVEVNTASPALLSYVAGITKRTAQAIFDYAKEHGGFKNRKELLKVSGIGAKAFEQCAGFLRVADSDCIFDNTAVHPESYPLAQEILDQLKLTPRDLQNNEAIIEFSSLNVNALHQDGRDIQYTLKDIISELKKPGRDPRDELERVSFKSDIMKLSDLKPGMLLKGTVRNVTHFGAFVDIGVHEDGLVHISEMSNRYITDPFEVVKVGDIINVTVLDVDLQRKRISLSMIHE